LFADFTNFTSIIEELPPEELVSGIDEYFETFDNITETHGVEKIKTVGDAYICASGLPSVNLNNPVLMVNVALDMIAAVENIKEKRSKEGKVCFDIRIGIHSGPLVAGVVGVKKFAYDIWGDTVNTAARMQQCGEPGRINISGTTHDLVKHRFVCAKRGKIEAKNKGLIDMYFVERKR
jgi:class 3 adenylate cyclase